MKTLIERFPIFAEIKRVGIALSAVLIVIVGVLVFLQGQKRKTDSLFALSDVYDTFIYEGTTYILSSVLDTMRTNTIHFLSVDGENEEYIVLPGEAIKWCETTDCFVYTDEHKARICDINGKNQKTIYTSPDGEYALVLAVSDHFAVIQKSRKLNYGASIGISGMVVVDLLSGEVFETEIKISESYGASPLTISDGWLYYKASSIGYGSTNLGIYRCWLETGACEFLTSNNAYTPESSFVHNGYLYFLYPSGSVNRIAIEGSGVENLHLDKSAAGLVYNEGTIYIACYHKDSATAERFVRIYSLEPNSKELVEVASTVIAGQHNYSYMTNIRVNEGCFVITGDGAPPLCIPLQ